MPTNYPISFVLPTATGGLEPLISYNPYPSDGYLDGGVNFQEMQPPPFHLLVPTFEEGARLTGTVTITVGSSSPYPPPAGLSVRLVIDGVPVTSWATTPASWPLNTTLYADGTHAFGIQMQTAPSSDYVRNSSTIGVINNSGVPFTSLAGQTVLNRQFGTEWPISLASGRCNVIPPPVVPLGHSAATHPDPDGSIGQQTLMATGVCWWEDDLQSDSTFLYSCWPMLVKNRTGDYHTINFAPQHANNSADSKVSVNADPAFDGRRLIANVSPYATFVPGHTSWLGGDGHACWVGCDITGRVVLQEISGAVTTLFGPRSVAGVVQTNPHLTDITLAQRITLGDKEYVGTGPFPNLVQDLWVVDSDTIVLADTGANAVLFLSKSLAKVIHSVTLTGVTGVWVSRLSGIIYAVAPDALYTVTTTTATSLATVAGDATLFSVRGDDTRGVIMLLSKNMGLYEYDLTTHGITTRRASTASGQNFTFMVVDEFGYIGWQGAIYYGADTFNTNVGISTQRPGEWVERLWGPGLQNAGNLYTRESIHNGNIFGHYLWGMAQHPTEAMVIAVGFSNYAWHCLTAHLGTLPPMDADVDPTLWNQAYWNLMNVIARDQVMGLESVFGTCGGGGLGYTFAMWRGGTIADVKAGLDAMGAFPPGMSDANKNALAAFGWAQRERIHFP